LVMAMYDKLDRGQVKAMRKQAARIRERLGTGQP